jgi:hypothetical protein
VRDIAVPVVDVLVVVVVVVPIYEGKPSSPYSRSVKLSDGSVPAVEIAAFGEHLATLLRGEGLELVVRHHAREADFGGVRLPVAGTAVRHCHGLFSCVPVEH